MARRGAAVHSSMIGTVQLGSLEALGTSSPSFSPRQGSFHREDHKLRMWPPSPLHLSYVLSNQMSSLLSHCVYISSGLCEDTLAQEG